MRLPLSILTTFIKTKRSPQEIADALLFSGTEIDDIIYPHDSLKKVVVGEVLSLEKHPDAHTLQVAKVKVGSGKLHTIVCGAPNITAGQKVPVALPGTTLTGNVTIKKATIRGVVSEGMICSDAELGLGDERSGIMVLDPSLTTGVPLLKALLSSPAVIDCDVTRNRPDLLSVEGLARDFAATQGQTIKELKVKHRLPVRLQAHLSVRIRGKELCNVYNGFLMTGVHVGPSPQWLQTALREFGTRPINNVVDITNYVMMTLGQPLHAFDAEKLSKDGKTIMVDVREAKRNEKLHALDGNEFHLNTENVVIADLKGPLALAGVIGGTESSVTHKTKTIVLEAALFHPTRTRMSAQSLGIRTESSTRFEKGLPEEGVIRAAEYAIELLQKYSKATITSHADARGKKLPALKPITVTNEFLKERIGIKIPDVKLKKILRDLGCSVVSDKLGVLRVFVPWWRRDLTIPEDIVEEIVRIFGINAIPRTALRGAVVPGKEDMHHITLTTIRTLMSGRGFNEIISYPYYSADDRKSDAYSMFCDGRYDHITLANPLRPEQTYLRKSIVPFVLRAIAKNIPLITDGSGVSLFEIGKIYTPHGNTLPLEETLLVFGATYKSGEDYASALFHKGIINEVLSYFNIDEHTLTVTSVKGSEIVLERQGKILADVQIVPASVLNKFKIKKPAVICEISITRLMNFRRTRAHFTPLPQFPSVTRDLSIVVPEKRLWRDIEHVVRQKEGPLEDVHFLNQYQLQNKLKCIAFRIVFRSRKKTLTSEEADALLTGILSLLKKRLGATLRTK